MTKDDLLSIGAFALLSGLSIAAALRHYHEAGVLPPALVDPATGYRRYRPAQIREARLICALRTVDLPIEEIRDVLEAHDEAFVRRILLQHRERLTERRQALSRMDAALQDYIERGVPMPQTKGCRIVEVNIAVHDLEAARRFYEKAFDVRIVEDRHGDGHVHLQAIFGTWPSDQFFLLNIGDDHDRMGAADFGFLVDDLDVVHARALAAGATEVNAPHVVGGMPRTSAINDPGGNRINLYQS